MHCRSLNGPSNHATNHGTPPLISRFASSPLIRQASASHAGTGAKEDNANRVAIWEEKRQLRQGAVRGREKENEPSGVVSPKNAGEWPGASA